MRARSRSQSVEMERESAPHRESGTAIDKARRDMSAKNRRATMFETVTRLLDCLPPALLERIELRYFSRRHGAIGRACRALLRDIAKFPYGAMSGREIVRRKWGELGTDYGIPPTECTWDDSEDGRRLAAIIEQQSDPRDRDLLLRFEPEIYRQGWYARRGDVVRHVAGEFYRYLASGARIAQQMHEDMTAYVDTIYWSRGYPPAGNGRAAALHQLLLLHRGEPPSEVTLSRMLAGMDAERR